MPESPNRLIVNSLIQTFQREIKPNKLYDCLRKMNADLETAYQTLFVGPLPAVDGSALTSLNAAVLIGELPTTFEVAYLNEYNEFSRGQQIVGDDIEEALLEFGFGDLVSDPAVDPTSYLRFISIADEEFYLSQNMYYDGSWNRDEGSTGALRLDFIDGELNLFWYDSVLADFRNTINIAGKVISFANFDDDDYLSFVEIDDNDVIHLGEDCAVDGTPVGHIAIPAKITSELPTASADAHGIIIIDRTTNRLCFYNGVNRYYVTGTPF